MSSRDFAPPLRLTAAWMTPAEERRDIGHVTSNENGIVSNCCFGSPVHVPWRRLADVVIKRSRYQHRWRTTVVDFVDLVIKDGKEIGVGSLGGKAKDIEAASRRVVANVEGSGGHS